MAAESTLIDNNGQFDQGAPRRDIINNPVHGETVQFLKRARDTDGEFVRFEVCVEPGGWGPPEHVHENQEEYFQVREGTLTGRVDGEPIKFETGDEYTVWPGTPHEWGNGGHDELRVLIEVRPALQFEEMLETFYGLARDGVLDESGGGNPLQMAVVGKEYWDTNHLTSPASFIQQALFTLLAPIGRSLGYKPYYPKYSPLSRVDGANRDAGNRG